MSGSLGVAARKMFGAENTADAAAQLFMKSRLWIIEFFINISPFDFIVFDILF
jgi:hypothetical protein